ncbi:MAG TPA: ABC transporter permease [Bryobacteraceae bacterium]|nr:ABC transporter permease [Bryobacteraceae bacterium]
MPALDSVLQDLRYTARTLRRDPGFSTIAVLILALGIGASTAVFSVVNALLLRPLPFRDSSRLVWVANQDGDAGLSSETTRVGPYLEWKKLNHSFDDLGAYFAFFGYSSYNLIGQGEPERLSGVGVSQNFFHVLGVQPMLGRDFTADESQWNGGRTTAVILTHALWVRRFASDPAVIGRKIQLNEDAITVVGVMPKSFDFAGAFVPGSKIDFFTPFPIVPETDRWGNTLAVIGRLRPGVSPRSAQAELAVIDRQLQTIHAKDWGTAFTAKVSPLRDHISGRLRRPMLVLAGAVTVVMLIVCANLSNLLLARAATRRKEIAVRIALGAGRGRLAQQMLTESLVLSAGGALAGVAVAFAILRALARIQTLAIPMLHRMTLDGAALFFTVAVAVASGVVFGLAPAFQSAGPGMHEALKDSIRGSSEGVQHNWLRDALVVSEIALACMLLVGAGLVIRSFLRVLDVDLGFQPERTASLRIDLARELDTPEKRNAFMDEILRRVRDVPGVQSAGLTDSLPMDRNRSWGAPVKGRVYRSDADIPGAFVRVISPGYLRAMGIPLRQGRAFDEHDRLTSQRVVLVNETAARTLWPGQSAIGGVLELNGDTRVVGVVGDVRHTSPDQQPGLEMYLPLSQGAGIPSLDLVVRTTLAPTSLAPAIRSALRPIAPNLPLADFRSLETLVDRAVSPRRFITVLLGGFAALALALASLGIYGIISYSVSQRSQEIGIRMALGASAANVQLAVIRQTLALAAMGIAIGAAGAWALTRMMRSLLFGIGPNDPVTFAAMILLLVVVAIAAGYVPARRASRVDPMLSLRSA